MKTARYTATLIGLITTVICGLVSFTVLLPFLTLLPTAVPLEFISGLIFGESNYPNKFKLILSLELTLLLVLCAWYFKKLIKQRQEKKKLETKSLIIFFIILQFVVHPIGFYIWLLNTPEMDPSDSMIGFYISETFPYSGCFFIFLGIVIDLIRNREIKETGSANAGRLS
ncbi:hypothetical protein [Fluviicola sp.]|jgi:hypothetical protein|uniref:hypothetical protein n=1 Tax=Fluviicola sp. TaxID=1917219 RepID=UPI002621B212|nr:hypothetical protein [Fluviicola sp.]